MDIRWTLAALAAPCITVSEAVAVTAFNGSVVDTTRRLIQTGGSGLGLAALAAPIAIYAIVKLKAKGAPADPSHSALAATVARGPSHTSPTMFTARRAKAATFIDRRANGQDPNGE